MTLTLTIISERHATASTIYLDRGTESLLEHIACADADALVRALRAAGATIEVVEDPIPCGDDCAECRCEHADERALYRDECREDAS